MGWIRMYKIRNEVIRGKAQVEELGEEIYGELGGI